MSDALTAAGDVTKNIKFQTGTTVFVLIVSLLILALCSMLIREALQDPATQNNPLFYYSLAIVLVAVIVILMMPYLLVTKIANDATKSKLKAYSLVYTVLITAIFSFAASMLGEISSRDQPNGKNTTKALKAVGGVGVALSSSTLIVSIISLVNLVRS